MMFIGSCTEWITPNFASTDRAMMEARISCPSPDMGLQSTLASAPAGTMSGAASVSVRRWSAGQVAGGSVVFSQAGTIDLSVVQRVGGVLHASPLNSKTVNLSVRLLFHFLLQVSLLLYWPLGHIHCTPA